jgi:uncharacterized membrane protein YgcG
MDEATALLARLVPGRPAARLARLSLETLMALIPTEATADERADVELWWRDHPPPEPPLPAGNAGGSLPRAGSVEAIEEAFNENATFGPDGRRRKKIFVAGGRPPTSAWETAVIIGAGYGNVPPPGRLRTLDPRLWPIFLRDGTFAESVSREVGRLVAPAIAASRAAGDASWWNSQERAVADAMSAMTSMLAVLTDATTPGAAEADLATLLPLIRLAGDRLVAVARRLARDGFEDLGAGDLAEVEGPWGASAAPTYLAAAVKAQRSAGGGSGGGGGEKRRGGEPVRGSRGGGGRGRGRGARLDPAVWASFSATQKAAIIESRR